MTQFPPRTHRARDMLLEVRRRWPDAFRLVEPMRQSIPSGFPPWCFLPVDLWRHAVRSIQPIADDRPALITQLAALSAWQMTQGIYQIDPTVYPAVVDTPLSGEIPSDALFHITEWCVFVETPGMTWLDTEPVHGFWAHLDCDEHGHAAVYFLQLSEEDGEPYLRSLFVGIGTTIQEDLKRSIGRLARFDPEQAAAVQSNLPEIVRAHEQMLSLLMYLCVETDDIIGKHGKPGNPKPIRTRRHGWKMFPADGPRAWDVGVRMGSALRAAYEAAEIAGGSDRHGPRPHVRRAHWHTILFGARKRADGTEIPAAERKRDVRWMPPIPVNLDAPDDLPAVIRRV